ncbi:protein STICHEL-like [Dorcoceras hygrometricum]|uniref:Protein STICHEL-like n=1 Tax=Dorcoceras hygrometricum TaxID=472368 RepID=A0A2Z7DEP1_9LAMI|nr:protein STICHEL-like [Dorcoceras hygrometricum]
MPPRRNIVQHSGESRNNDSGSSPGGSRREEALTTERIMQLVASTVEQVLARRGGTQPESRSQSQVEEVKKLQEEAQRLKDAQPTPSPSADRSVPFSKDVLPSQLGGRHSYPVVTAPTIALDVSGTTQQSSSHNVAPNQLNSATQHANPTARSILQSYTSTQALTTKNRAQTTRITHPKAHASRRTQAQTALKSFELQQFRVSNPALNATSQMGSKRKS